MAYITVTATVRFDYDTKDGFITSVEDACEDVRAMIASGDLAPDDFDYITTEED